MAYETMCPRFHIITQINVKGKHGQFEKYLPFLWLFNTQNE